MRAALRGESVRSRLEHDPHRGGDWPKKLELGAGHHAGIHMREEPRLCEDELAHAGEVVDRRLASELRELLACGAIAKLRLVAEREESLVAARLGAGSRDGQNLVATHVGVLAPPRGPREGAVVADVPAEHRQRDEDLGRVGDDPHAKARSSGRSTSRARVGSSRTTGSRRAARAWAIISSAGLPKRGSNAVTSWRASAFTPPSRARTSASGRAASA